MASEDNVQSKRRKVESAVIESNAVELLPEFSLSEHNIGIENLQKFFQSELESSGLEVPSPQEIIDALNSLDDTYWNVMNSVQILAVAYGVQYKERNEIRIIYQNDEITNLVNKMINHILESTEMEISLNVFCADSFYGLEKVDKEPDSDRIAVFTNPKYKERIELSVTGKFDLEEINSFISDKIRFGLPIMNSFDIEFFSSIDWEKVKEYTEFIDLCISPRLDPRELKHLPRKWLRCQIHFRETNSYDITQVCTILKFLDKTHESEYARITVIFSRCCLKFENQEAKEMLSILKKGSFLSAHFDTVFPMTKEEENSLKKDSGFDFVANDCYFKQNPIIYL